jgi:hypothetical protein
MIKKVCIARHEAYRKGVRHVPTKYESFCTCSAEVSSFLRAESYHFIHSSHDEKLERELGEKCHCMLTTEYKKVIGNGI